MTERAVIIPGYGDSPQNLAYQPLNTFVEASYPHVDKLHIPWNNGTYDDWLLAARKQVSDTPVDVFAFSCGALIALHISNDPQVRIGNLILLSTSSWGGGKGSMESSEGAGGPDFSKEQYDALENLPVEALARGCGAKAVKLPYGENELPEMKARSEYLAQLLGERATTTMVPGATHYDMLSETTVGLIAKAVAIAREPR